MFPCTDIVLEGYGAFKSGPFQGASESEMPFTALIVAIKLKASF
jgi:hypothetical protein